MAPTRETATRDRVRGDVADRRQHHDGRGDPVQEAEPDDSPRVLVIDDEPPVTDMIEKRLRHEGAECVAVHSGEEALRRVERQPFDVVVTDVYLPGVSGLELTSRIKEQDPRAEVIVMTGHTDEVMTSVEALRNGADDYLLKPFSMERLAESFNQRLEHRRLVLENQGYRLELEERVETQARRLDHMYLASVRALVTALEAKDPYTRGHSQRVARYAMAIGKALDGADPELLRVASQLHDIGKIGMRDEVLRKRDRLTDQEFEHVRQHPNIGARILAPIVTDMAILNAVRSHHEYWDGTGYPDGLAGRAIPPAARIVCLADALDAMTSPRPYRAARSWQTALEEIAACRGTQFAPEVADAALDALAEPPDRSEAA